MLILTFVTLAGVLAVLCGGSLKNLALVPLRDSWVLVPALGVQLVAFTVIPALSRVPSGGAAPRATDLVVQGLHAVSYALAVLFLIRNLRLPGLVPIALGTGLNALAISLNAGTLPASASAMRAAGFTAEASVTTPGGVNSGVLSAPRLAWLGDVFAVPAQVPLANVFSIGDILIVVGCWYAVFATTGTRWSAPRASSRLAPVPLDRNQALTSISQDHS